MLHRRSEGGVLCLITPTTKVGGKKNRSCWKLKSKSEKENENERRPQKLVFSCLHFVDSPSFTIYDLFASKIKLLHVSQLSFDSWGDKKPKITINIHIRSFVTSLWATQPPNPTIIYKTLFCHSFSFGLNGLSKVPNFIWFSHCSTWFACTASVGKQKKITKHGVSEKKSKWLKMKLWWAITHIDKDPHLSRMIGTGIAGLIAVLWPASRIRNVALTRQLSGKVCGQGWLACLRKGYFSNSLAMGKWYTI